MSAYTKEEVFQFADFLDGKGVKGSGVGLPLDMVSHKFRARECLEHFIFDHKMTIDSALYAFFFAILLLDNVKNKSEIIQDKVRFLCEMPLEEMPLYMASGSGSLTKQYIAEWRLQIGK